jgi:hypothetical protein
MQRNVKGEGEGEKAEFGITKMSDGRRDFSSAPNLLLTVCVHVRCRDCCIVSDHLRRVRIGVGAAVLASVNLKFILT